MVTSGKLKTDLENFCSSQLEGSENAKNTLPSLLGRGLIVLGGQVGPKEDEC